MDRAVLARHGESELSLLGRTNGDPTRPVGLTPAGREQARQLGRELAAEPIDLCVTSEFERARETADLALENREVPRLVLAELNDIRFGEFEGLLLTEYRAWAHAHGPEEPVPGGESRAETVRRYVRGYSELLARREAVILVVAHGLPVRYVLDAVAGRNPAAAVAQVPYAEPFHVPAEDLEAALARLGAWVLKPVWD